ncbi:MAG: hypothetical protein PsegKO_25080 [Pseudohongiellaceae bacterium]
MSSNQSPYMLETSANYLRAAKILWRQKNLEKVAMVNAAIAIEIILKSFTATPVDNKRKGTIAEQYEINGKQSHSLVELAKCIDKDVYRELGFQRHEYWFQEFDCLFMHSRYPYEPSSRAGSTEIPITAGIEIFRSTIDWYKRTGNRNPWIMSYPDVPGGCL